MLWTSFPDELDTSAVKLIYDAWKGGAVDKPALALACFNVLGFAASKVAGATESESSYDAESAFQMLMGVDSGKQAVNWAAIFAILKPIIIGILGTL